MTHLDLNVLQQLVRGELPDEEAAECRAHLDGCAECRALHAEQLNAAALDSAEDTPRLTGPGAALAAEDVGPMNLARGASVGRYLVLDKLGQGGMGEVYAAFDPKLERRVALKLLLPSRHDPEASATERLLREAQAMAQLSHPNVLPVFDVGEHEGRVFIAMELVEGQTLRRWQKAHPQASWREVLRPYLDAGRGLAAAHKAGLVHRDFKPDNVLLSRDGRVYVMDFGLARSGGGTSSERGGFGFGALASGDPSGGHSVALSQHTHAPSALLSAHLTRGHGIVGTPGYMPPEQIRNEELDARADVFAFCVALYAALYRQKPFGGGTDARALLDATLQGRVAPPPRDSRVPAWLHRVVLRGLASDREQRTASMDVLLAALQDDPSVRRRRWAAAAALVVVAAGGTATWRRAATAKVDACEADAATVTAAWSPERAAQVEQAFRATGLSFAPDVFRGTRAALDAYATAWRQQRADACLATRVRGEASPRVLALRSACLDARRRDLAALTDLLARADAQVVEKASGAVSGLPTLAGCADVDALARAQPRPTEPAALAKLEAVEATLARAGALDSAGKYKDGLDVAAPALADAQALGFAPLTARALYTVGQLQAGLSRMDEAEETLKQALLLAEAQQATELKASVLSALASTRSLDAATARGSRDWAALGLAAASTLEGVPRVQAGLHRVRGRALVALEDFRAAEREQQQALALAEQGYGKDSRQASVIRNELAHVYFMQGHYERALGLRQEALASLQRALGPDHPETGIGHGALGMTLSRLGRHAEAIEHGQRALDVFTRALPEGHRNTLSAMNNLAIVFKRLGRVDEALALYHRALALHEKTTGPRSHPIVTVTLNIGEALRMVGRLDEAEASYTRGLAVAEQVLPPTHSLRSDHLEGLAQVQLARGRARAALALAERSLKLRTQAQARAEQLGDAHLLLAKCRWAAGLKAEARSALATAHAAFLEASSKDGLEDLTGWAKAQGLELPRAPAARAAAPAP